MKVDMHYYATYALSLAAGIPKRDAQILAYASQYVDDSTNENGKPEPRDKSLFVSMTTAHHFLDCACARLQEAEYQRKVWVPNHFIPGGRGNTFEEKSICLSNSEIARKMFEEHIEYSCSNILKKDFGLELIGIAAHAYMDTFSHYGFSGFCSKFNNINNKSIKVFVENKVQNVKLNNKIKEFNKKNPLDYFVGVASFFIENITAALGHGSVFSLPDLPFLEWEFAFEENRPCNGNISKRSNKITYLEASKELYLWLAKYAEKRYDQAKTIPFSEIEVTIAKILAVEGDDEERISAWKTSGLLPDKVEVYDHKEWEDEKNKFCNSYSTKEGIETSVYHFHQAAAYHRYYMLKDLLPRYGIAVY